MEKNQNEIISTVCILLQNTDNQILTVSRKDNYNDLGLIGGKIESTDSSPEMAAIRETKEETNLDIYDLVLLDKRIHNNELIYCYTAKYKGFIKPEKNGGMVEWCPAEVVTYSNCSFSEYNKIILSSLNLI